MLTKEEIEKLERHHKEMRPSKTAQQSVELIQDYRDQIADIAWLEEENKSLKARIRELEAA